jgi:hypothetical protein
MDEDFRNKVVKINRHTNTLICPLKLDLALFIFYNSSRLWFELNENIFLLMHTFSNYETGVYSLIK